MHQQEGSPATAYSPWINLGAYRVPLSSIRIGPQQRRQHLEWPHRHRRHVTCMCVPDGVPMGIAVRAEPPPAIYYLYHLHRGDPVKHSRWCPHYAPPPPQLEPGPDTVPQEAGQFHDQPPLAATLDSVVAMASLNLWRPSFLEKRTYFRVRYRLIEAAKHFDIGGGATLGESLYVPPIWDNDVKTLAQAEWDLFLDMLNSDPESPQTAYVLGLAKSYEVRPGWTAPRLLLSSHLTPFWLDEIPTLLPFPAEKGHHWLVLLKLRSSRSKLRYRVVDGASILMSKNWIPVHSTAHARLADEIAPTQQLLAPLAHDSDTAWAVPDFIVEGDDRQRYLLGPFGARRPSTPSSQAARP